VSEQTTGKGRPTPKRSEAQKRRSGPVAPPPTSRREAAKQLRAKQAENRQRVRKGSLAGDETALLKRDQGPVRKMVRELIDSRRSLGWILLHKVLVNGQGHQLDAIAKSVPLQVAQVRAMVLSERLFFGNVHLAMENIHTFHAELKLDTMLRHSSLNALTPILCSISRLSLIPRFFSA